MKLPVFAMAIVVFTPLTRAQASLIIGQVSAASSGSLLWGRGDFFHAGFAVFREVRSSVAGAFQFNSSARGDTDSVLPR
jgi:hypothetical protein